MREGYGLIWNILNKWHRYNESLYVLGYEWDSVIFRPHTFQPVAKLRAEGIGTVCGRLLLGTAEKIPESEIVDTTGAGDAFIGAVLYGSYYVNNFIWYLLSLYFLATVFHFRVQLAILFVQAFMPKICELFQNESHGIDLSIQELFLFTFLLVLIFSLINIRLKHFVQYIYLFFLCLIR